MKCDGLKRLEMTYVTNVCVGLLLRLFSPDSGVDRLNTSGSVQQRGLRSPRSTIPEAEGPSTRSHHSASP